MVALCYWGMQLQSARRVIVVEFAKKEEISMGSSGEKGTESGGFNREGILSLRSGVPFRLMGQC